MASGCHEIDPDGDVELILRNPNAPFAEWDENLPAKHALGVLKPSEPVATQTSKEAIRMLGLKDDKKPDSIFKYFESLDPCYQSDDYESESETVQTLVPVPKLPKNELPKNDVKTLTLTADDVTVRMRLSSKHLMLASTFFKKMLQGPWVESRDGTLEASDWDAKALLILMNIIHGRNRAVPRSISLEMLAKISVLVDYYQCHEVIELFLDCWMRHLRPRLPKKYGRDLTLWLAISWVFHQKDIFTALTKVAIEEMTGPFQTLELPIPQHVVEAIDQRRQDTINDIISVLHDLKLYFYTRTICTFECSSILLGVLSK